MMIKTIELTSHSGKTPIKLVTVSTYPKCIVQVHRNGKKEYEHEVTNRLATARLILFQLEGFSYNDQDVEDMVNLLTAIFSYFK